MTWEEKDGECVCDRESEKENIQKPLKGSQVAAKSN